MRPWQRRDHDGGACEARAARGPGLGREGGHGCVHYSKASCSGRPIAGGGGGLGCGDVGWSCGLVERIRIGEALERGWRWGAGKAGSERGGCGSVGWSEEGGRATDVVSSDIRCARVAREGARLGTGR